MRGLLLLLSVSFASALALRLVVVDPQAARRSREGLSSNILASPGPELLAMATMEHGLAWADLTWLAIVQQLSEGTESSTGSWDRVERWTNIAVDLDPKYFTVYHSVAVQLSAWARRPDAADALLLKGMHYLPQRWELPFLLGFNAYFARNDFAVAADWMEAAMHLPGSPAYLPALAGRMRFQSGSESAAIELLQALLEELEGPARDNVEARLLLLRTEIRLRNFDQACLRYRQDKGTVPAEGSDLVEAGYIQEQPFDFFGNPVQLDENCRARTKMARVREDEAADYARKQQRGGEEDAPK